jgi:hypothetical protein
MSTFFLVPKKEVGEWHPILNLKPLNRFIRPQRFRMETLRTILESIVTPAWGHGCFTQKKVRPLAVIVA